MPELGTGSLDRRIGKGKKFTITLARSFLRCQRGNPTLDARFVVSAKDTSTQSGRE